MPGFPDSTHLCDRLLPEKEFAAAFARLQAAGIAYFGVRGSRTRPRVLSWASMRLARIR
jgi:hypothetical protein